MSFWGARDLHRPSLYSFSDSNSFCSRLRMFRFFFEIADFLFLRSCFVHACMRACKRAFLCACVRVDARGYVSLSVCVFRCVHLHYFLFVACTRARVRATVSAHRSVFVSPLIVMIHCMTHVREMSAFLTSKVFSGMLFHGIVLS